MQHCIYHLPNEAGTIALGTALARTLSPGLIIYLYGDLGTGKTTLTRALLHAAGHDGRVKSPTYTLAEPYALTVAGQTLQVMHFDLYRMTNPREFLEAGLAEEFNGRAICIVEWPEKAEHVLPSPDLRVFLNISAQGRDVKLQAMSDKGCQCLDHLKFAPNL